MTMYEAIDLQLQRFALAQHSEEVAILAITIYVSLAFAFLGGAYAAGAKLSKAQALIGSAIFTLAGGYTATQVYKFFKEIDFQQSAIAEHYLQMAEQYGRPEWIEIGNKLKADAEAGLNENLILGLMIAGILGCLYFMWSVRHPRTE